MSIQPALQEASLVRASRRSALISLLGILVVIASLGYSAYELRRLSVEVNTRTSELNSLREDIETARAQLKASREAVSFVTQGINLYHQGQYRAAVTAYDQALQLDPQNPYVANLKGYSLFKAKQLGQSIESLKYAVEIDPNYAWGFFDLTRVLCASKQFPDAEEAAHKALQLRPGLREVMLADGEFTRLCRPILETVRDVSPM